MPQVSVNMTVRLTEASNGASIAELRPELRWETVRASRTVPSNQEGERGMQALMAHSCCPAAIGHDLQRRARLARKARLKGFDGATMRLQNN
jgi:hypothetical protein